MRLCNRYSAKPNVGDKRVKKRFSFLPVTITGHTCKVWLEWYFALEEYRTVPNGKALHCTWEEVKAFENDGLGDDVQIEDLHDTYVDVPQDKGNTHKMVATRVQS